MMKKSIKQPLVQIIVAYSPSKTYSPIGKPIAITEIDKSTSNKLVKKTRKVSAVPVITA